jgi:hypothetical protein
MIEKELLEKIKEYIEKVEVEIDEQFAFRNLRELLTAKEMPEIYYEICKLLEE